jgi:hypothetical protein
VHEILRALVFVVILTVPAYDGEWPTLGFHVVDWMREMLVHGPGDIKGEPLRLSDEKVGEILRMYEIYPPGHELAGRRRFSRCGISVRKGLAKTELGALIAAAELHPEGPVRCAGFTAAGNPVPRSVNDPFIPMVAYTEEQSDELAYGALRVILLNSRVAADFDIGHERILRKPDGDGKAVSLASSPGARDGARTTFQLFDETHRFITPELRRAHQTMLANIPKRGILSEPWSLEITTAPDPSENSVALKTYELARAVSEGRATGTRFFYFHRQAPDDSDLSTREGRRAAVLEATGPHEAAWSDIEAIVSQFDDPTADHAYLRRVWLNQLVRTADRAFDPKAWASRAKPGYVVPPRALITLGFDGALSDDAVALIGTEVTTGHQFKVGIWERPFGKAGEKYRAPERLINEAVLAAFEYYDVHRFYADPQYWETWVALWARKFGKDEEGKDRVVRWYTNQWRKMAYAIRAYHGAIESDQDGQRGDAPSPAGDAKAEELHADPEEVDPGDPESSDSEPDEEVPILTDLSHDGDSHFARHIANAHKMVLNSRDGEGERLWVIQKDQPNSPHKMDAAVAGALSWQARLDAIAAGAGPGVEEDYGVDWV